jgi:acetyl esterase/lipase
VNPTTVSYVDSLSARVFRPTGPNHRTAVLHVHGGGWRHGRPEMLDARSAALAALGFTVIAPSYRLVPAAAWPAAVTDLRSAIRWTAAHAAELDVDPERTTLHGHSAGAHIALVTAATLTDPGLDAPGESGPLAVAAVVACYPPTRFTAAEPTGPHEFAATAVLDRPATAAEAAALSPIDLVRPGFPPTLLLHGAADRLVAPVHAEALYARLRECGVAAELSLFAGQDHEFDTLPSYTDVTARQIAVFLRNQVADQATLLAERARFSPF